MGGVVGVRLDVAVAVAVGLGVASDDGVGVSVATSDVPEQPASTRQTASNSAMNRMAPRFAHPYPKFEP